MKQFFFILIAMALVTFPSKSQVTYSDALYRNAQAGDAQAMADLGLCYAIGEGVDKNPKKAMELYQSAYAKGNIDAMRRIGNMYLEDFAYIKDNKLEAIKWFKKAADMGDVASMFNIGYTYYKDDYGAGFQDYSKAIEWFKKASDLGDTDAMNLIGICYYDGTGVKQDFVKAVEYYKKASDKGNADAMSNLASMYFNGEGLPQDYSKAIELYKKAAINGSKGAYYDLGLIYYNGEGVAKSIDTAIGYFAHSAAIIEDYSNPDEAFEILQYICQYENKDGKYSKALATQTALYDAYNKTWDKVKNGEELIGQVAWGLALCYTYAIGTPRNIPKAKELLDELLNNTYSMPYHTFSAAELYERGDLGSVDYTKAFEFYDIRKNVDPGNCGVMTAKYLIEGKGVTKDVNEAIKRLNDAIYFYEESGSEATFAKYVLGKLYFEGTDVKQNRAEAFKLFKAAAEDEEDPNDEAMNMLSTCYRFGFGTAKDLKKAEYWLKKAEETGNEKARRIKQLLGH